MHSKAVTAYKNSAQARRAPPAESVYETVQRRLARMQSELKWPSDQAESAAYEAIAADAITLSRIKQGRERIQLILLAAEALYKQSLAIHRQGADARQPLSTASVLCQFLLNSPDRDESVVESVRILFKLLATSVR